MEPVSHDSMPSPRNRYWVLSNQIGVRSRVDTPQCAIQVGKIIDLKCKYFLESKKNTKLMWLPPLNLPSWTCSSRLYTTKAIILLLFVRTLWMFERMQDRGWKKLGKMNYLLHRGKNGEERMKMNWWTLRLDTGRRWNKRKTWCILIITCFDNFTAKNLCNHEL